jgi:hypothetical protein
MGQIGLTIISQFRLVYSASNDVRAIAIDEQGNKWIGTVSLLL